MSQFGSNAELLDAHTSAEDPIKPSAASLELGIVRRKMWESVASLSLYLTMSVCHQSRGF